MLRCWKGKGSCIKERLRAWALWAFSKKQMVKNVESLGREEAQFPARDYAVQAGAVVSKKTVVEGAFKYSVFEEYLLVA